MKTVIGVFSDRVAVADVIEDLRDGGFIPQEISQIVPMFSEILGSTSLSSKELQSYKERVEHGAILVTIRIETAGEYDEVMTIMDDYGAEDITVVDQKASSYSYMNPVDRSSGKEEIVNMQEIDTAMSQQASPMAVIGLKGGKRSMKRTFRPER